MELRLKNGKLTINGWSAPADCGTTRIVSSAGPGVGSVSNEEARAALRVSS